MLRLKYRVARQALAAAVLLGGMCPVFGAAWKTLPGHVPPATQRLTASGRLPATSQLRLAIGVPLRDPAGLDTFLAQVYDPASPIFHQFLTSAEAHKALRPDGTGL